MRVRCRELLGAHYNRSEGGKAAELRLEAILELMHTGLQIVLHRARLTSSSPSAEPRFLAHLTSRSPIH